MYTSINSEIMALSASLRRAVPQLIAVSKMQPNENVIEVLRQGHRVFGENRVQEAARKWPAFRTEFGEVQLHLLGPLQTNKVRQAFDSFNVIHSVDRSKLVQKIAYVANERGRCPDLYIQVNIGREPQKAGVLPENIKMLAAECHGMNLPVIGLMCIPPDGQDPRPYFKELAVLAKQHNYNKLSMGMSGDYRIAIEEGATAVRVGSAIFGARKG